MSNRLLDPFGPPAPRPEFVAARSLEPIRTTGGLVLNGVE
jgi:hypothetical protein